MKRITYRKVIDGPAFQWDLSAIGRNSEVFVADADGSNEVNASKDAAFDGWPVWSPDGKMSRLVRTEPAQPILAKYISSQQTVEVAATNHRPGWLRATVVVSGRPAHRCLPELGDCADDTEISQ